MEQFPPRSKTGPVKRLVEDFRSFSISQLGRGVLHRDRSTDGGFWLDETSTQPEGRYRISHQKDGSIAIDLSYPSERTPAHHSVQLEAVAVTYGLKPFLRCPNCESRRNKLQIDNLGRIACRECFDLAYQSTREKHSNPLFRTFRRHMKLREKRAEVRRVVYGGVYTRKARSVLRLAGKIGKECHRI